MHLNKLSCNSLIGGWGEQVGTWASWRWIGKVSRTMHCFPKLQEPRYEMGLILMTLTMPNTSQLAACQEVILARSFKSLGSQFWSHEEAILSRFQKAQGVPFLSPFYLASFPQLAKQPTICGVGGNRGNRQDTCVQLEEVIHVFFVISWWDWHLLESLFLVHFSHLCISFWHSLLVWYFNSRDFNASWKKLVSLSDMGVVSLL